MLLVDDGHHFHVVARIRIIRCGVFVLKAIGAFVVAHLVRHQLSLPNEPRVLVLYVMVAATTIVTVVVAMLLVMMLMSVLVTVKVVVVDWMMNVGLRVSLRSAVSWYHSFEFELVA